jgi:hypothetical protein
VAARKSSTRSKPQPEAAISPEAAVEQPEGPEVDQPLDAVIVVKTVSEDGTLGVKVVPNGSVQVTEVQTLLEIGLKNFREQIGLGQAQR